MAADSARPIPAPAPARRLARPHLVLSRARSLSLLLSPSFLFRSLSSPQAGPRPFRLQLQLSPALSLLVALSSLPATCSLPFNAARHAILALPRCPLLPPRHPRSVSPLSPPPPCGPVLTCPFGVHIVMAEFNITLPAPVGVILATDFFNTTDPARTVSATPSCPPLTVFLTPTAGLQPELHNCHSGHPGMLNACSRANTAPFIVPLSSALLGLRHQLDVPLQQPHARPDQRLRAVHVQLARRRLPSPRGPPRRPTHLPPG